MAISRRSILEHFARKAYESELDPVRLQEKIASFSASAQGGFAGEKSALTAVVRCDLNGYSKWCRDQPDLKDRVDLLDDYFTKTILCIHENNGVYFRDEGDCVVVLFSDYFSAGALSRVRHFCRRVSEKKYGKDGLTAKNTVSVGEVVYYQKVHEKNSDEWSADGDPFIFSARMEAEAESGQIVHFAKSDFDDHFSKTSGGNDAEWKTKEEGLRISGLWTENGWKTIVKDYFAPPKIENSDDKKSSFANLIAATAKPDPFEKRSGGKYA